MPTQVFIFSGAHPWTAPAGVRSVFAECVGGGADGGSPAGGVGGAGGPGGSYASAMISVTPGRVYAVTVGAAAVPGQDTQVADAALGVLVLAPGGGSPTVPLGQTTAAGGAGGPGAAGAGGGGGGTGSMVAAGFDGGAAGPGVPGAGGPPTGAPGGTVGGPPDMASLPGGGGGGAATGTGGPGGGGLVRLTW